MKSKQTLRSRFEVALWLSTFALCSAIQAEAELSVGSSRRDITPSTEVLSWITLKPYPGVLDPVYARAVVVAEGAHRIALVTWDLTDTREHFVARVRRSIAEATGIAETNILINASHTHSAPWVPAEGDVLVEPERHVLVPVQASPAYKVWAESVVTRTTEAVKEADQARKPATLSIGRAWAGDVIFNRRPIREDGRVETAFTPANPVALPQGQRFGMIDPTLSLLAFEDASHHPLALLFSLPCHPVSVYPHDDRVSADWPGVVAQSLQEKIGGNALFFQGCAGDIVPVRRNIPARDRMGQIIAERTFDAWTNRSLIKETSMEVRHLPLRLPLAETARKQSGESEVNTEVQLIRLGSLVIVALPGEPLSALAMEIQRRSPYPHTLVFGYSNGGGVQYVGASGDKRKGGYEMTDAGLGEDRCGQTLVESAVKALQQMRSAELVASTPKPKMHLYLLIGQSNMAGRGTVEAADQVPHPRLLTVDTHGNWSMALDPLHHDKVNAGVGLGSWFGRWVADGAPDATIGLIPAAVGGTPLSRWMKGGDLYQQAVAHAKIALQQGELKGILWHQGENDADIEANAKSYAERLTQMIADLREELGVGEIPFVAGKLGLFLEQPKRTDLPFVSEVNEQLAKLPGTVPNLALVDSAGLTSMPDLIHFDTVSLRELGRRYAIALKSLEP